MLFKSKHLPISGTQIFTLSSGTTPLRVGTKRRVRRERTRGCSVYLVQCFVDQPANWPDLITSGLLSPSMSNSRCLWLVLLLLCSLCSLSLWTWAFVSLWTCCDCCCVGGALVCVFVVWLPLLDPPTAFFSLLRLTRLGVSELSELSKFPGWPRLLLGESLRPCTSNVPSLTCTTLMVACLPLLEKDPMTAGKKCWWSSTLIVCCASKFCPDHADKTTVFFFLSPGISRKAYCRRPWRLMIGLRVKLGDLIIPVSPFSYSRTSHASSLILKAIYSSCKSQEVALDSRWSVITIDAENYLVLSLPTSG